MELTRIELVTSLTASFPLIIAPIVLMRLTPGTARHTAAKKRNFRTPDATVPTPPGGVEPFASRFRHAGNLRYSMSVSIDKGR